MKFIESLLRKARAEQEIQEHFRLLEIASHVVDCDGDSEDPDFWHKANQAIRRLDNAVADLKEGNIIIWDEHEAPEAVCTAPCASDTTSC